MTVALAWALVHVLWQSALLAVLYSCVQVILRSSATRHVVGMGLLVSCPLLFTLSIRRILAPPAEMSPTLLEAAGQSVARVVPVADHTFGLVVGDVVGFVAPWVDAVSGFIVGVWLAGAILLLARLVVGFRRVRCIRAAADPVSRDSLRELGPIPTGILRSERVAIPMVIGFLRPTILIPADLPRRMSRPAVRALVAHEIAHVRRRDPALNLIQLGIECVFWFSWPLLWLSGRIRVERELCCDEHASREIGRMDYIRVLLRLEQLRSTAVRLAPAATGGSLLERSRRLVGSDRRTRWRPLLLPGATAVTLGLLWTLAAGHDWAIWQSSVALRSPDPVVRAIDAVDPAGRFVLTLDRGMVRGVEVDGAAARVAQRGSSVLVVPQATPSFSIRLEPDGGFRWEARPAPAG